MSLIEQVLHKSEPLHEKAYQLLRNLILSGKLTPDEPFGETSLAAELGVSRTPVRDALRRLQQDRLITLLPNGAYEVRMPTVKELAEVYDCRSYLESMAARLAANHRTETDLVAMRSLLEQMRQSYDKGDEPSIRSLDALFHEAIVAACDNSVLLEIVVGLRTRLAQVRNVVPNPRVNAVTVLEQHQRIVDAIAAGDGEAAESVMREHIAFSRKVGIASTSGSKE